MKKTEVGNWLSEPGFGGMNEIGGMKEKDDDYTDVWLIILMEEGGAGPYTIWLSPKSVIINFVSTKAYFIVHSSKRGYDFFSVFRCALLRCLCGSKTYSLKCSFLHRC